MSSQETAPEFQKVKVFASDMHPAMMVSEYYQQLADQERESHGDDTKDSDRYEVKAIAAGEVWCAIAHKAIEVSAKSNGALGEVELRDYQAKLLLEEIRNQIPVDLHSTHVGLVPEPGIVVHSSADFGDGQHFEFDHVEVPEQAGPAPTSTSA